MEDSLMWTKREPGVMGSKKRSPFCCLQFTPFFEVSVDREIWNDFIQPAKNTESFMCFINIQKAVTKSVQSLILAKLQSCFATSMLTLEVV
jgi:hypothetical protein